MQTMVKRNKWDSVTIKVRCPEGTAFVQILEHAPGEIYKIFMNVGKAGSSINAQCYALCELVTELFECGKGINDIIVKLSGITSDRSIRVAGGVEVRSIPEALVIALMKYRTTVPQNQNGKKLGNFLRA